MKLVFIRHGEPDYEKDSLTETGFKEAALLADRVAGMEVKEFFVSPLGRAKDTAAPALERIGRSATELDWIREFDVFINRPDKAPGEAGMAWDWLPADWMSYPDFYDKDKWMLHPLFEDKNLKERYEYVIGSFEAFLNAHGYSRNGLYYNAENASNDTLVFFSHFGCATLLLSHLLNVSPMILWHGMCMAPTSVTTIVTEERKKGIAQWRCIEYGDTSHLYASGMKPSFAARFCECFDNENERHG